MPSTTDYLKSLQKVHQLIQSRPQGKISEFAASVDLTITSFYFHLNTLRQLGADIATPLKDGGLYYRTEFEFFCGVTPPTELSDAA